MVLLVESLGTEATIQLPAIVAILSAGAYVPALWRDHCGYVTGEGGSRW